MTIRLKPSPSPGPSSPFSWDNIPATPPQPPRPTDESRSGSPPTQWLTTGEYMNIFGAEPIRSQLGVVKCKECGKPILESNIEEHAKNCAKIRSGGRKGAKKGAVEVDDKKGKKRKAEDDVPDPDDPSAPKKKKPATKVTKGRMKGPVDLDKQCGVINDKGLPCSRSLTCKSHSMGAKRAVLGRSRPYNELLLDWHRLNNPNFVEPTKRETKAERKERKEKEKAEKKKSQMEAAAAAGVDLTKKPTGTGGGTGTSTKKSKKATTTAATGAATTVGQNGPGALHGEDVQENDDVDSEVEVDSLVNAVQLAQDRGVMAVPLAIPCDASSWFVMRRERLRNCRELLAAALIPQRVPSGQAAVVGGARLA